VLFGQDSPWLQARNSEAADPIGSAAMFVLDRMSRYRRISVIQKIAEMQFCPGRR
jgi:hypothetical protein